MDFLNFLMTIHANTYYDTPLLKSVILDILEILLNYSCLYIRFIPFIPVKKLSIS